MTLACRVSHASFRGPDLQSIGGVANHDPQAAAIKSHAAEDDSEKAFRSLFNSSNWAIRRLSDDYGRDLEVELFENNETTGITFGVQLKSIDKEPRKGRISISEINAASVNYWRSLDVPFMVAAYSLPANRMFFRWAHSYDWHHKTHAAECTADCTPGPKTVLRPAGRHDHLRAGVAQRLDRLGPETGLAAGDDGDLPRQVEPGQHVSRGRPVSEPTADRLLNSTHAPTSCQDKFPPPIGRACALNRLGGRRGRRSGRRTRSRRLG